MELLRTEGLRKEYGSKDSKVVALKPTNLIINKGEFTAIVGPSGLVKVHFCIY